MEKWIKIIENDSFIVDYNKETNTYRVSYFEDNHFKDEILFKGEVESEWKAVEEAKSKTWTTEELQESIINVFEPPYIYQDTEDTILNIPDACKTCSNHPRNGGNGICNCILGLTHVNCATNASIMNGGKVLPHKFLGKSQDGECGVEILDGKDGEGK